MSKLLTCLLFAISAQALADNDSPESYWQDSTLNFNSVKTYFNSIKCFEIKPSFTLSCIDGFNQAGSLAIPKKLLVTDATLDRLGRENFRLISDFQHLKLVEMLNVPPVSNQREYLVRRANLVQELALASEQLFLAFKDEKLKPFNFADLIVSLRTSVPNNIPDSMIAGFAISGQLVTHDSHGGLMPAKLLEERLSGGDSKRTGVGILLHQTNRGFRVFEVVAGSAAASSGIVAGDLIYRIGRFQVDYRASMEDVIRNLLGPVDSQIEIEILRGKTRLTIPIRRKEFKIKTVRSNPIEKGSVGYVRVLTFMDDSVCTKVESDIKRFIAKRVKGIVLDLRNNSGGLMEQARCLAGLFLPEGSVVTRIKAIGVATGFQDIKTNRKPLTNLPLVVLTNEVSASASELFAGAMQDFERAIVVGKVTFGKGSVQDVEPFELDQVGMTIIHTTQLFYQPNGRTNQGVGITPDIEVSDNLEDGDDGWVAREFDLFPSAIHTPDTRSTALEATPFRQRIRKCVADSGVSLHKGASDPQLEMATATVNCLARSL